MLIYLLVHFRSLGGAKRVPDYWLSVIRHKDGMILRQAFVENRRDPRWNVKGKDTRGGNPDLR